MAVRSAPLGGPGAAGSPRPGRVRRTGRAGNVAARAVVLSMLGRLSDGALIVTETRRRHLCGRPVPGEAVPALDVADATAWRLVLRERGEGLRRAYAEGLVTCADEEELVLALRVLLRNVGAFARTGPLRRLTRLARAPGAARGRLPRLGRPVPLLGGLDDAGLGRLLASGIGGGIGRFARGDEDLADAQRAHLRDLVHRLELSAADDVLEVADSWTGFAVVASATVGCKVTAVVTSPRLAAHARGAVTAAGMGDLVEVVTELPAAGAFDKVAATLTLAGAPGGAGLLFGRLAARLRRDGRLALELPVSPLPGAPSGLPDAEEVLRAGREAGLGIPEVCDLSPDAGRSIAALRHGSPAVRSREGETTTTDALAARFDLCAFEAALAERRVALARFVFSAPRWRARTGR